MKKMLTRIIAIVACLTVAVCCFTACNKDDGKSGVKGLYKIYSMNVSDGTDSQDYNLGDAIPELNITELTSDSMKMELKDNGIATSYATNGSTVDGTWTQDSQDSTKIQFSFSYGGQPPQVSNATIIDGTMTMTQDIGGGYTLTYILKK